LKIKINNFCSNLGKDSLLIQGAGGNISWKDGNKLWIKASGTWLADANIKDIFVPVDLSHLRSEIKRKNYSIKPKVLSESSLKPSIETLMHALMDHKVVLHLHSIEILSNLVKSNILKTLKTKISSEINWALIPYNKPGEKLAESISDILNNTKENIDVLFLKNHGVVIGGENLEIINKTLNQLTNELKLEKMNLPNSFDFKNEKIKLNNNLELHAVEDFEINNLVHNSILFQRLKTSWCLYPDHIVFLDHKANCFDNLDEFVQFIKNSESTPKIIFIRNYGIFSLKKMNLSEKFQLRCYYDVIIRQSENSKLDVLSKSQINELLNWDAEKYRINLSK
jgi:rhamnose utilization protein RhaD (predicted bifunctional aldolase and dehydrogenase)